MLLFVSSFISKRPKVYVITLLISFVVSSQFTTHLQWLECLIKGASGGGERTKIKLGCTTQLVIRHRYSECLSFSLGWMTLTIQREWQGTISLLHHFHSFEIPTQPHRRVSVCDFFLLIFHLITTLVLRNPLLNSLWNCWLRISILRSNHWNLPFRSGGIILLQLAFTIHKFYKQLSFLFVASTTTFSFHNKTCFNHK